MNGRKPTCFCITLTEDNNDLTHTHDGKMTLSPTPWCYETLRKQLSINSVVDECTLKTEILVIELTISWYLSFSRFLVVDMSVELTVGLDFVVKSFT